MDIRPPTSNSRPPRFWPTACLAVVLAVAPVHGQFLEPLSDDYARHVPETLRSKFLDPEIFEGGRFQKLSKAVVRLVIRESEDAGAMKGACSAFVIDAASGYAVSAKHCMICDHVGNTLQRLRESAQEGKPIKGECEDRIQAVVETYVGNGKVERRPAESVTYLGKMENLGIGSFLDVDAALIKIHGYAEREEFPPEAGVPGRGTVLYSIGYPSLSREGKPKNMEEYFERTPRVIVQGEMHRFLRAGESDFSPTSDMLVVRMNGAPGQSGGVVFDGEGRWVGIFTSVLRSWEDMEALTRERYEEDPLFNAHPRLAQKLVRANLKSAKKELKNLGIRPEEAQRYALVVPAQAVRSWIQGRISPVVADHRIKTLELPAIRRELMGWNTP